MRLCDLRAHEGNHLRLASARAAAYGLFEKLRCPFIDLGTNASLHTTQPVCMVSGANFPFKSSDPTHSSIGVYCQYVYKRQMIDTLKRTIDEWV